MSAHNKMSTLDEVSKLGGVANGTINMHSIRARKALTSKGWEADVLVTIDAQGLISSVEADVSTASNGASSESVDILLPSPSNIHSHAFQRAMAGMTERRGPNPGDSFWAWRKLMYRFLDHLGPDDIEAITAFAQMEMLQAGYASCAEFHYLHHAPDGRPYADIAETSVRVAAAAEHTGIGLTLLPVLYEQGGCDGRALRAGQLRFGNDRDQFERLVEGAGRAMSSLGNFAGLGVAPHSLRAAKPETISSVLTWLPDGPVHIHVAEQMAEIEEVKAAYGARPVNYLFNHYDIDRRWCFIHATHLEPDETLRMAGSDVVAGLCPITEANLGDGIFDGERFIQNGGSFGIGTDSNVKISLSEELRLLEYSQRLKSQRRAVLATDKASTGRVLFDGAVSGGAQAAARNNGAIKPGLIADFLALDGQSELLFDKSGDAILDSYIFAGDDRLVTDVWSGGRHLVKTGAHIHKTEISRRFKATMISLKDRL